MSAADLAAALRLALRGASDWQCLAADVLAAYDTERRRKTAAQSGAINEGSPDSRSVLVMQRFWRWLSLAAYRRWAAGQPSRREPVGVPHRRDPDFPCNDYEPRTCSTGGLELCEGDGHYLCAECAQHAPTDNSE